MWVLSACRRADRCQASEISPLTSCMSDILNDTTRMTSYDVIYYPIMPYLVRRHRLHVGGCRHLPKTAPTKPTSLHRGLLKQNNGNDSSNEEATVFKENGTISSYHNCCILCLYFDLQSVIVIKDRKHQDTCFFIEGCS